MSSRVLLATVAQGNHALVDLGPDDFVIEEGGTPRDVFDMHVADYPLVVLIDNSAAARNDLDVIRDAAARFVSRVGERAVAVGTLADPPALLASFDDERAKVLAVIRAVSVDPSAGLMPLQAIARAVAAIEAAGTAFSAIVVISTRAIEPAEIGSPDLLTPILDSRASVHVIARRPAAAAEHGGPARTDGDGDVLRQLSSLTRGQYTTIYSPASYGIALDGLADRLAAEMMIEFLEPPGQGTRGEVRVGVKIPGARVTGLGVSR
jgi:von Willebrand factor type A domain